MPPPVHPSPSNIGPLHLYRHLLREVSYLPPAFRAPIASTIHDRFHRNRKHDARPKAHIKRARSALRTIRAANCGDKPAMESLMSKGFGRSGGRRRELMSRFVMPQGPIDSKALETLLDAANEPKKTRDSNTTLGGKFKVKKAKNRFYEKWDRPKLLQLIQSQKTQQKETKSTTSWPGTSVKSVDQDQFVPETNIWGKPPAENIVRAKRAHWWRRSADKLMPPLGKGEWELLEKLANGAQQSGEWRIATRRAPAQPMTVENPVEGLEFELAQHLLKPASVVEHAKAVGRQRRSGQKPVGPYGKVDRQRALSDRWYRRAYNRVWQLTPNMEQDPNTLKHSVTWGSITARIPEATESQLEIFEGVDKRGRQLKSSRP